MNKDVLKWFTKLFNDALVNWWNSIDVRNIADIEVNEDGAVIQYEHVSGIISAKKYSYNDLFFWHTGFLECIKWKHKGDYGVYYIALMKQWEYTDEWIGDKEPWTLEYNLFQLCQLKSDEERMWYVLEHFLWFK